MRKADELTAKKQLLVAQAEFDRLRLALAAHDLRRIVRPRFDGTRHGAAQSLASRALGMAMPVLGASGAGRVVRALSIALSVYRFLRGFSGR